MNPRQAMFEITRRRVKPTLISEARRKFQFAKEWLIDAVESHPISQDLINHSNGKLPISNGSLFGFFGFRDGSDPVGDLINFLEAEIVFQEGASGNKRGLINAYIKLPSKENFNSNPSFKLQWGGQEPMESWPVLMEEGLSGLEHYLYVGYRRSSRSGEGIQVAPTVRDSQFGGRKPYLQALFTEFRKKVVTG